MSTPKINVSGMHDREKVRAFLEDVQPEGASLALEGKCVVWLFKPTERGGRTIARIVDRSNDEKVEAMIQEEWGKVCEAKKAAHRAAIAALDADDEAGWETCI